LQLFGAFAVTFSILPYALASAGAMIFVVVEENPETQQDNNTDIATMGCWGFIVMMVLDVALG
jgi:ZIP family zinc transporter